MDIPNEHEEITPEESVVPVYAIPVGESLFDEPEFATPDEMIAAQQELKDSALAKLTKFGLTEGEAKAVIGL